MSCNWGFLPAWGTHVGICVPDISVHIQVSRCRQPGVCSPHHPSWCWGKCQSGNPSQPSSPWPWHQAGLAAGAGGIHLILCATRTASFTWSYIYTVVQVSHFDSKHYSYSDISSLCIIWHCTLSCNFFCIYRKLFFSLTIYQMYPLAMNLNVWLMWPS